MSSNHRTFVKTRAVEIKLLYILVFLGLLGSAWLLRVVAQLAFLELHRLVA